MPHFEGLCLGGVGDGQRAASNTATLLYRKPHKLQKYVKDVDPAKEIDVIETAYYFETVILQEDREPLGFWVPSGNPLVGTADLIERLYLGYKGDTG